MLDILSDNRRYSCVNRNVACASWWCVGYCWWSASIAPYSQSTAKQKRNEAREDAYLGYIDALLKIKVDDQYGTVKSKEFLESFRGIQARLRLYGSKNIIHKAEDLDGHLYECWECGNIDVGNTEELKMDLIASMRKELHID